MAWENETLPGLPYQPKKEGPIDLATKRSELQDRWYPMFSEVAVDHVFRKYADRYVMKEINNDKNERKDEIYALEAVEESFEIPANRIRKQLLEWGPIEGASEDSCLNHYHVVKRFFDNEFHQFQHRYESIRQRSKHAIGERKKSKLNAEAQTVLLEALRFSMYWPIASIAYPIPDWVRMNVTSAIDDFFEQAETDWPSKLGRLDHAFGLEKGDGPKRTVGPVPVHENASVIRAIARHEREGTKRKYELAEDETGISAKSISNARSANPKFKKKVEHEKSLLAEGEKRAKALAAEMAKYLK